MKKFIILLVTIVCFTSCDSEWWNGTEYCADTIDADYLYPESCKRINDTTITTPPRGVWGSLECPYDTFRFESSQKHMMDMFFQKGVKQKIFYCYEHRAYKFTIR